MLADNTLVNENLIGVEFRTINKKMADCKQEYVLSAILYGTVCHN